MKQHVFKKIACVLQGMIALRLCLEKCEFECLLMSPIGLTFAAPHGEFALARPVGQE